MSISKICDQSLAGPLFSAIDFGVVGDGKTDNTVALQAALDEAAKQRCTVYLPAGEYLSGELKFGPHTGLVGDATWAYRSAGGTRLRLNDDKAVALLNITGARGATINGLTLHGDNLGSGVHGIYMGANPERREEDAPRIERCHISHFSGDGIHLDPVWCFSVRSCEVIFNKRHGLWMVGWDGFVLDNWFSGNGGAGYAATKANASMTLTGNRIEWNRGGGIMIEGGSHYNITGNYIDRAGGPGITLRGVEGRPCLCMTATGNVIYRSGKPDWTSDEAFSAHALLEKCHGVVFSGNSMCVGRDDSGGLTSPQYGIIIKELKNSIVKGNTLHIGAITELVRDLGGHGEGVVVAENVGSLYSDIDKSIWESGQR